MSKAKKQQSINIGIIKTQFDVLQHAKVEDGYTADVKNAINIIRENINNYKAANDSKKSIATREKYQTKYQANKDSALTILQRIIESVSYQTKVWNHITNKSVEGDLIDIAKTAEDIYQAIKADAKDFPPNFSIFICFLFLKTTSNKLSNCSYSIKKASCPCCESISL